MTRIFAIVLLFAAVTYGSAEPSCPHHAEHAKKDTHHHDATAEKDGRSHHAGVDHRGDHVMGFSHEKTKHTFRLLAGGGAVEVRAIDPADAESIRAIREHLQEIAKEFASGDFAKPHAIHNRVPDGVAVMQELGNRVTFRYEELEQGARVRIATKDPRGLEAVHQFLRFQIEDHRTGDSGKVE